MNSLPTECHPTSEDEEEKEVISDSDQVGQGITNSPNVVRKNFDFSEVAYVVKGFIKNIVPDSIRTRLLELQQASLFS